MMKDEQIFITINGIGDLFIRNVLASYVCPIAFVCLDRKGTKYLFYEIVDEKTHIEWLVTELTDDECNDIINRKKAIQNVFKKSTCLKRVRKVYSEESVSYKNALKADLNMLPEDDVYADESSAVNLLSDDILEASQESGMEALEMSLLPEKERDPIPYETVLDMRDDLKSLMSSLYGSKTAGQANVHQKGSAYSIRLSLPQEEDPLEMDQAERKKSVLNELLHNISVRPAIKKAAHKKKFMTSYSSLIKAIRKTGGSVMIVRSRPGVKKDVRVVIKPAQIAERDKAIKDLFKEIREKIHVEGTLTNVDAAKSKFTFISKNGDSYEGVVSKKKIIGMVRKVPSKYTATIEATKKVNKNSFAERKTYALKDLKES